MTREMRFGEGDHARHSGCAGEFVPHRTDRFEPEIPDDALKQIAQQRLIPQALGFTVRSFDQPFRSYDHPINLRREK